MSFDSETQIDVLLQTVIMVLWTLVYAVLIAHHVTGRPSWLPPPPALPMRGEVLHTE